MNHFNKLLFFSFGLLYSFNSHANEEVHLSCTTDLVEIMYGKIDYYISQYQRPSSSAKYPKNWIYYTFHHSLGPKNWNYRAENSQVEDRQSTTGNVTLVRPRDWNNGADVNLHLIFKSQSDFPAGFTNEKESTGTIVLTTNGLESNPAYPQIHQEIILNTGKITCTPKP